MIWGNVYAVLNNWEHVHDLEDSILWASPVAQLVKNPRAMWETWLIPGLGRSFGEGKGYPLQYSGLENSVDYIVHRVEKSQTGFSDFHFQTPSVDPHIPTGRVFYRLGN